MTKPEQFISTTDYSTLKNDDVQTLTFVIPGSIVIPASAPYYYVQTQTIQVGGVLGATARVEINTSRESSIWYSGSVLQVVADGTWSIAGGGEYPYYIFVSRTSATTVTARVYIPNDGGAFGAGSLTTEATARTVNIRIATFLPPFA